MMVLALPYTSPDYTPLVRLTGVSEPAYSLFWYEPRLRHYQAPHYTPYPEMPACDRLGFVYRLAPPKSHSHSKQ